MASGIIHGDTGVRLEKPEMEGAALHVVTADLDVATHKIINLVDPTSAQDAVTKQFLTTLTLAGLLDISLTSPQMSHFLKYNINTSCWNNFLIYVSDIPNLPASKTTSGIFALARIPTTLKTATITYIIDGAGVAITTGQKGHLEIPFACTIQRVTMLADQVGSIVVDIWKTAYIGFPPTDGNSITASAPPTISAAQKSQDSTLSFWLTSICSGAILAFNVDSCATITRVTISLKVTKT